MLVILVDERPTPVWQGTPFVTGRNDLPSRIMGLHSFWNTGSNISSKRNLEVGSEVTLVSIEAIAGSWLACSRYKTLCRNMDIC